MRLTRQNKQSTLTASLQDHTREERMPAALSSLESGGPDCSCSQVRPGISEARFQISKDPVHPHY